MGCMPLEWPRSDLVSAVVCQGLARHREDQAERSLAATVDGCRDEDGPHRSGSVWQGRAQRWRRGLAVLQCVSAASAWLAVVVWCGYLTPPDARCALKTEARVAINA